MDHIGQGQVSPRDLEKFQNFNILWIEVCYSESSSPQFSWIAKLPGILASIWGVSGCEYTAAEEGMELSFTGFLVNIYLQLRFHSGKRYPIFRVEKRFLIEISSTIDNLTFVVDV